MTDGSISVSYQPRAPIRGKTERALKITGDAPGGPPSVITFNGKRYVPEGENFVCHVARDDDPKRCRYCGTHVEEERME